MGKPIYELQIKKTGEKVRGYKLDKGGFCDWDNMTTEYAKSDVLILNEIPID